VIEDDPTHGTSQYAARKTFNQYQAAQSLGRHASFSGGRRWDRPYVATLWPPLPQEDALLGGGVITMTDPADHDRPIPVITMPVVVTEIGGS
jgi:hypothetical protein